MSRTKPPDDREDPAFKLRLEKLHRSLDRIRQSNLLR